MGFPPRELKFVDPTPPPRDSQPRPAPRHDRPPLSLPRETCAGPPARHWSVPTTFIAAQPNLAHNRHNDNRASRQFGGSRDPGVKRPLDMDPEDQLGVARQTVQRMLGLLQQRLARSLRP
jgi:hypothetical protein